MNLIRRVLFSDDCLSRLRQFLDDAVVLRKAVGDTKQTIHFGVAPDLESVAFKYHEKSVRLNCLSPYQFPETEYDLLDTVGEYLRDIRVTGYALKASSNAMALVSGSYDDVLSLSSHCQFSSDERARFAFPIRHDWTAKEMIAQAQARVPFELAHVKVDRHRFVLLEKFQRQLYGDWVLCVLDSPKNEHQSSVWMMTFPGGKRLLGETSLECCIREMNEEIGLLADMESLQKAKDLVRVAVDEQFCAFVLHPKDFILLSLR